MVQVLLRCVPSDRLVDA